MPARCQAQILAADYADYAERGGILGGRVPLVQIGETRVIRGKQAADNSGMHTPEACTGQWSAGAAPAQQPG